MAAGNGPRESHPGPCWWVRRAMLWGRSTREYHYPERRSWPSMMPHTDANWLNRSPKSSFPCGSWRAICWALLRSGSLSGCLWNFQGTAIRAFRRVWYLAVDQPGKAPIRR